MEYPSIIATWKRILIFYLNTFFEILPFALLASTAKYFLFRSDIQVFNFYTMVIFFLLYTILYCCALYALNQINSQGSFDYIESFTKGGLQSLEVISMILLLLVPIFILLFFLKIFSFSLLVLSPLFVLMGITYFFIFPYALMSEYLIVVKILNVLEGIQQSWKITRHYWWKTMMILSPLFFIMALIFQGISLLYGKFSGEITTLFTFSLSLCVLIIHGDILSEIHQEKINSEKKLTS